MRANGEQHIREALRRLVPDALSHDLDRYANALACAAWLQKAAPTFRGTAAALDQLALMRSGIDKLEDAILGMDHDEIVAMRSLSIIGVPNEFFTDLLKSLWACGDLMRATERRLKSGHQHANRETKPRAEAAWHIAEMLWRYSENLGHDPRRGSGFQTALKAIFEATGIDASAKNCTQVLRDQRKTRAA